MAERGGTALIYIPSGVDPGTIFTGRPLLERALALAVAADLEPRVIDCATGTRPPRARMGDRLDAANGPVILLRCDVGCVAGAVRDLIAATDAVDVVYDDRGRVALVRTTASALAGAVPPDLETAARGRTSAPRPGWLGSRRILALDATSPASLARAEAELVGSLDNPRDGVVDRVLNRSLSRPLSRRLLALPITPNGITIAALLIALLGATGLARPGVAGPVLGALLLQITAVLDCVDGEIARAKVLESEWGEWLDITADTLIHIATFLGIAVHAWPELGHDTAWLLGGLFAGGGLASFVVVTRAEKTEDEWQRIDSWQARLLASLLVTLTTRDSSVLVFFAAAAQLLTPLLIGAAFGAQLFWVGALALHLSVMRRAERSSFHAVVECQQRDA
jgi:phosphatidylglycerophosphate synthase